MGARIIRSVVPVFSRNDSDAGLILADARDGDYLTDMSGGSDGDVLALFNDTPEPTYWPLKIDNLQQGAVRFEIVSSRRAPFSVTLDPDLDLQKQELSFVHVSAGSDGLILEENTGLTPSERVRGTRHILSVPCLRTDSNTASYGPAIRAAKNGRSMVAQPRIGTIFSPGNGLKSAIQQIKENGAQRPNLKIPRIVLTGFGNPNADIYFVHWPHPQKSKPKFWSLGDLATGIRPAPTKAAAQPRKNPGSEPIYALSTRRVAVAQEAVPRDQKLALDKPEIPYMAEDRLMIQFMQTGLQDVFGVVASRDGSWFLVDGKPSKGAFFQFYHPGLDRTPTQDAKGIHPWKGETAPLLDLPNRPQALAGASSLHDALAQAMGKGATDLQGLSAFEASLTRLAPSLFEAFLECRRTRHSNSLPIVELASALDDASLAVQDALASMPAQVQADALRARLDNQLNLATLGQFVHGIADGEPIAGQLTSLGDLLLLPWLANAIDLLDDRPRTLGELEDRRREASTLVQTIKDDFAVIERSRQFPDVVDVADLLKQVTKHFSGGVPVNIDDFPVLAEIRTPRIKQFAAHYLSEAQGFKNSLGAVISDLLDLIPHSVQPAPALGPVAALEKDVRLFEAEVSRIAAFASAMLDGFDAPDWSICDELKRWGDERAAIQAVLTAGRETVNRARIEGPRVEDANGLLAIIDRLEFQLDWLAHAATWRELNKEVLDAVQGMPTSKDDDETLARFRQLRQAPPGVWSQAINHIRIAIQDIEGKFSVV